MHAPLFQISTFSSRQIKGAVLGGLASVMIYGQATAAELGTVVSSTPVMVQTATPQQQCYDEPQAVEPRTSGAGAIAGAVIGGLIGNNFGGGTGRAAATGLGVIAGAALGDRAEAQNQPNGVAMVRRCQTVNGYEQRVVGYDVVYDYNGRRYSARLPQDPGAPGTQMPLEVNVAPSGAGAQPPQASYPPPNGSWPPVVTQYAPAPEPVYVAPPAVYVAPPVYYAPRPYYGAPPPYYRGGVSFYIGGGHGFQRDERAYDRRRWPH